MTTVLAVKFNNIHNYTDTFIMTEEEYNKLIKRMDDWEAIEECQSSDYTAWDPIIVAKNLTKKELSKFNLESDKAVAYDILTSDEYGFTYDETHFAEKLLAELNYIVLEG